MTGLGRCGTNFALDRWGVEPDIIVVGKGLAAGYMPLSAVIASPKVVAPFLAEKSSGAFEHGFTYSGHPLACAAGLAVNDYLREHEIVQSVAARSNDFSARMQGLMKYDFVGDVRVSGFLGGIEFVSDRITKAPFPAQAKVNRVVADAAWQAGLIVYPGAGFLPGGTGDHIMVAPPLNISDDDMDTLFSRLDQVFATVDKQILSACR
jgi:adenosylmethionine-8-amino-7-oxononanoate aminotransferase